MRRIHRLHNLHNLGRASYIIVLSKSHQSPVDPLHNEVKEPCRCVTRGKLLPVRMPSSTNTDKNRDTYPLNRDFLASSRLHLQHHVWISSLGYLLHPSIPLKESLSISDIGCGTGIWSLDFAKQLPSGGKIEAFDLSPAQFPPKGWWPGNVTFNELDIFQPIPPNLVGKFDVVCLRHFICVVQSGDPIPLLSALLKLLKPGGYLQWQEWNIQTNSLAFADSEDAAENVAPKMKAYMDSIRGPDSLQSQASWVEDFHTRFGSVGADLVAHERHWTAKEAMMLKQELGFLGGHEWADNLRARDPASVEAAKLEKLVNEAHEECLRLKRSVVIDSEMVTWVVMKK